MSDTTIKDVQNLRQLTEEERNREWQRRQNELFMHTVEMAEWAYEQWAEAVKDGAPKRARRYARIFTQLRDVPMPFAWVGSCIA